MDIQCPKCANLFHITNTKVELIVEKIECPKCSYKIHVGEIQENLLHSTPASNPAAYTAVDKYDAAIQSITQNRGKVYGHPLDDFNKVSIGAAVIAECSDPEIRHVLYMLWVKMCRLIETPSHEDSWVDISGYARTGVMVLSEREVRASESPDKETVDFFKSM